MALNWIKTTSLALAASVVMATGAIAATFSFEGSYTDENNPYVQYFEFSVIEDDTNIRISTFEYVYGHSSRDRIETDGILGAVNLFNSAGDLIGTNDPDVDPQPDPNYVNGALGTSPLFVGPLAIGTYKLAMNVPDYLNSVSDSYTLGAMICADIQCELYTETKMADWVVDVEVVPLPAGLPLLAAGLVGFGILRRRQKH